MNLSSNTILITGGGSGIGLALAERFINEGNKVIICGRDEKKLSSVKDKHKDLSCYKCDISNESERISLYEKAVSDFPELNVFVNNAGIQQRIRLAENPDWSAVKNELEVNLLAHIHLAIIFIPHLLKAKSPAIINITSGLAFAPLANVPVYCATKAAMHSFTMTLRHQLTSSNIEVIEIAPPAVQTDLGGKGLHDFGTPLNEFADSAMSQLKEGSREITYGFSAKSSRASRTELDEMFKQMNSR
jgi:uncharacterized oxidoreductase